mgnify:CR=1 FL=1
MRRQAKRNDAYSEGLPDNHDAGVYVAVFRLDQAKVLRVGALGEMEFAAGCYAYVGSALSGLHARLTRHMGASRKKLHWHIDYLARNACPLGAFAWLTREKLECRLSSRVAELAHSSVAEFGASDCNCRSHLHFFRHDPRPVLEGLELKDSNGTPVAARIFRGAGD